MSPTGFVDCRTDDSVGDERSERCIEELTDAAERHDDPVLGESARAGGEAVPQTVEVIVGAVRTFSRLRDFKNLKSPRADPGSTDRLCLSDHLPEKGKSRLRLAGSGGLAVGSQVKGQGQGRPRKPIRERSARRGSHLLPLEKSGFVEYS